MFKPGSILKHNKIIHLPVWWPSPSWMTWSRTSLSSWPWSRSSSLRWPRSGSGFIFSDWRWPRFRFQFRWTGRLPWWWWPRLVPLQWTSRTYRYLSTGGRFTTSGLPFCWRWWWPWLWPGPGGGCRWSPGLAPILFIFRILWTKKLNQLWG